MRRRDGLSQALFALARKAAAARKRKPLRDYAYDAGMAIMGPIERAIREELDRLFGEA